MDKLETAALNGDLFNPHRSPSPARSTSPDNNTDDELGSDISRPASPVQAPPPYAAPSRGAGAQTGPKGVITDRKNQRLADRLAQETQRLQVIEAQQRRALTGATSQGEDELRERERLLEESEEDGLAREQWRAQRRAELERQRGGEDRYEDHPGARALMNGRGQGRLREVGMEGFLEAVERPGWAVILIYEPVSGSQLSRWTAFRFESKLMCQEVPRCNALLASMLALALQLPPGSPLTLLRARATSLEFSLLPPIDPHDLDEEARPDKDVLPTLLAYKNGDLQKTWIRVDWEVGEDGVEGLLRRYVLRISYECFALTAGMVSWRRRRCWEEAK